MCPECFVYFRTCSAFAGHTGHTFAKASAAFFGCKVGGHHEYIGVFQPGYVELDPGSTPDWTFVLPEKEVKPFTTRTAKTEPDETGPQRMQTFKEVKYGTNISPAPNYNYSHREETVPVGLGHPDNAMLVP
jgi:hypothetical protein